MKRIMIVGSGGAGKSTLARRLGQRLGLPVFHLDAELWKPGWVMASDVEAQAILKQLVTQEAWVIDGNYSSTMETRLRAADTLIFLDYPRLLCLWRVMKRWARYYGRSRPDITPGCPEKLDPAFLKWIWNYPRTRRPKVMALIRRYADKREIVILHTPKEASTFIRNIKPRQPTQVQP